MTERLDYEPLTLTEQWQLRHAADIVRFPEEAIFHRLPLPDLARAINNISSKDFDDIMDKAIGDHATEGDPPYDVQSELTETLDALSHYQQAKIRHNKEALPQLLVHALEEYGDVLILRERMQALAENNPQLLPKLERLNRIHASLLNSFEALKLSAAQAQTLAEIKHTHRHARALAGLKAKDKQAERILMQQAYDSIKK